MLPTKNELIPLIETQDTLCVSIFLPLQGNAPHENLVRAKNLLRQAAESLAKLTCCQQANDFLRATSEALRAAAYPAEGVHGSAAFACRDSHREFQLPMDLPELASVGRRFHIRPLLPLFAEPDRFYILALSQKHARLFEANRFEAEQLQAEGLPADLGEILHAQSSERELQFHAATAGGGKSAVIYHGGRNEPKDHLANFLRDISGVLFAHRNTGEAPLVIAAVEYVASMYRAVNGYPNLVKGFVAGNPDLLTSQQLHAKALEIVQPHFDKKRERAISECAELSGTNLGSQDLQEISAAARAGRVRTLLIAGHVHKFDAGGEDMLNRPASQTLLDGGTVYEVPQPEMPNRAEIAAAFRY